MDIVIVKCDFNYRYGINDICIAFSIPDTVLNIEEID